ncbi:MAG: DUF3467 domain-containing protein [Chloroflexi bacterium]|nr:MAG: DUF3467 domain-containing protein [Chloroflexota bacterium]TME16372.1 MAG: DUF3467 domain-containing protein [Chloroflexota bacterium]
MPEQDTPGLGVQVKVQESASQVVYTDAVLVNGSPLGFILNFGQWAPEQPNLVRVYSRVGMSPNHLKMLAALLQQNVEGYEKQFGPIPVAPLPNEPPHSHVGFEPAKGVIG